MGDEHFEGMPIGREAVGQRVCLDGHDPGVKIGDEAVSITWSRINNDLIHRVVQLFPECFAGVSQLSQSVGGPIANALAELERCVTELGFVGCNLNPDPSGGLWSGPPLTDRY